MTRVLFAFTCSGSRKSATPSEIASRPVSEDPPLANARSKIKIAANVNKPCGSPTSMAPGKSVASTGSVPCESLQRPIPKTINMLPTKKYVGKAKAFPASLTPRKFPYVSKTITTRIIGIFQGLSDGKVEMIAATPAAD